MLVRGVVEQADVGKDDGVDPEIDFQSGASTNGAPNEFQSMGTPTYYVFRINLGF